VKVVLFSLLYQCTVGYAVHSGRSEYPIACRLL
jgi:hypothetical protein